ncbi:unnamed protein product [Pseudo-nitzschia multistriata]|uniref:Uncharacterized protein n=1 Tax=Pseudo-nitzschia multistriata TaxID=183589 RepID=A0A448Z081_9STRA|nr:unnamed protein product [Pseudo-nitzschia multistriata]
MNEICGFSSSRRRRQRKNLLWNSIAVLISVGSMGSTYAEDFATQYPTTESTRFDDDDNSYDDILFFDLPSMAITLDVDTEDNVLIPFEDKLTESIEHHLEHFYQKKLLTSEIGNPKFIHVDLESNLLWTEVSMAPNMRQTDDVTFVKKYQVQGIFNSKIKLQVEPIVTEEGEKEKLSLLNQVLMDLFFLEAFEDDYQWDLLHGFLLEPLLHDIINVEINIMDSGFVHPHDANGNLVFEQGGDDFYSKSIFSLQTKDVHWIMVGVILATSFLVGLIALWICLCIATKGGKRHYCFRWLRGKTTTYYDDKSLEGSSVTGSTSSHDSVSAESEATSLSYNLDAWANAITSITLRNPARRKKRGAKVVKRPYFRPSDEHSSDLSCIAEGDNESCTSTVKSAGTSRSERSRRKRRNSKSSWKSSTAYDLPSLDSSSVSSALSSVIYEEEPEKETADSDENANGITEDDDGTKQSAPLLSERGLIRLMPSDDEDDILRCDV